MALTNKLYDSTRRTALTAAAFALTGLASLVTPSYSAETPQQTQNQVQERNYTFEEFKKAYGEKEWAGLNDRKKVIEKWSALDNNYKKALIEIYQDPEDFYKNHLTEEQRKEYEEFTRTELPTKDKRKDKSFLSSIASSIGKGLGEAALEDQYPWIINASKLSLKEKLAIYMDFRLQKSFNSQDNESKK
jgi:hypothetical protein